MISTWLPCLFGLCGADCKRIAWLFPAAAEFMKARIPNAGLHGTSDGGIRAIFAKLACRQS